MVAKYYLLQSKLNDCNIGSILKYDQGYWIDLDRGHEIYIYNFPNDALEIFENEANFLLKKNIITRLKFYNEDLFGRLYQLKINDTCYYFDGNNYYLSTIVQRHDDGKKISFTVMSKEYGQIVSDISQLDLKGSEIENIQDIEEIIKVLLNRHCDIQENYFNGKCLLSMAYELKDKRYFKMFIAKYFKKLEINMKINQKLLFSIVEDKHWDLLQIVLDKCNVTNCDSDFIMVLSLKALRQGDNELLKIIFKFIANTNKLKNGETFLTNLFKENIEENTIKKVIEMKLFNLNIPNENEDTPLILACDNLMTEVVKALLMNGSDTSYKNYAAFERLVFAKAREPAKEKEANEIKNLLMKPKVEQRNLMVNHVLQPAYYQVQKKTSLLNARRDKEKIQFIFPVEAAIREDVELLNIVTLLFTSQGDITKKNTKNECSLYLAYKLKEKRFYNMFLQMCPQKIDIMGDLLIQSTLFNMIDSNQIDLLIASLKVFILEEKYDEILLALGLRTLLKKMENAYMVIVKFCSNKDIIMKNNETFLTSLFKDKVDSKLIINVISSKYFDFNKPNGKNETILMLACKRLMSDVVEVLLKYGADISFEGYRAVDLLVTNGNILNNIQASNEAKIKIMNLIIGKNEIKEDNIFFLVDKVVNTKNIKKVQEFQCLVNIGDYVVTSINLDRNNKITLKGEIKWIGLINDHECVGIDLEDECQYGMDGILNENCRFDCLPGHGIVTTASNVKKNVEVDIVTFNEDGFVDPNKFIRSKEYLDKETLNKSHVYIGGAVYVNVTGERKLKMRGILRWCGTMNGEYIGVVELDCDYKSGTDGCFWRQQLFQCKDKRAVGTQFKNISNYISYTTQKIPQDKVIFKKIKIDSKVIYYKEENGILCSLYGHVRWTGLDTYNDICMYGIELEEEIDEGTDGEFKGMQLFFCKNKYGVVVPINVVAPVPGCTIEGVEESKSSELCQYCIPNKRFRGKNYGIQGSENSTFLDSIFFSLFSKSHYLDFMISPMVNNYEKDNITKKLRKHMSWNIVYPLREYGFVSFHKMNQLRNVVSKYGQPFEDILKEDPDMKIVAELLRKLCPAEPLLSFINFNNETNNDMFLTLLEVPANYISTQQLLEMSMAQSEIMLHRIPDSLILYVPRNEKNINDYKSIVPLKTINISQLSFYNFKTCCKCDIEALFQCKECVKDSQSIIKGLFCRLHKCRHKEKLKFRFKNVPSKSDFTMDLKSVISIENNHYVAYVKEDKFATEWLHFDSQKCMNLTNESAVPVVSLKKNITDFLNKENHNILEESLINSEPEIDSFLKTSCIFLYESSIMTCY